MTDFRNNLLTRMIRLYSFEHEAVIDFARMCEKWRDDVAHDRILEMLVETHEEFPQYDDDEEE